VPRREKNNPKTIEQIHREAQEEEREKQAAIQRAAMEQRTSGGGTVGSQQGPPRGARMPAGNTTQTTT